MRLKVTLQRDDQAVDLIATVDATVRVGDLAERIVRSDPRVQLDDFNGGAKTLRVDERSSPRVLDRELTIAEAGVRSGTTVSVVAAPSRRRGPGSMEAAATLIVLSGRDEGDEHALFAGANLIGRSGENDVQLEDELISKRHAQINVGSTVEIVDLNSSNGVLVGAERVARAWVRAEDVVRIGDTSFRVVNHVAGAISTGRESLLFNRSPRLDSVWEGSEVAAPKPPSPPGPSHFPWLTMLAPLLMGIGLFAVTRSAASVLFIALSPLMILAATFEQRREGRKSFGRALAVFEERLATAMALAQAELELEGHARRAEFAAPADAAAAAIERGPALWSLRPDRRGFLDVRLGLGCLPSRNSFVLPYVDDPVAELWARLEKARSTFTSIERVPVVASLGAGGSLGIVGSRTAALGVARAAVAEVVSLHSPAEVVLAVVASSASGPDWSWVRWLPHVTSEHSPLPGGHLADNPGGALRLVSAIQDLVDRRLSDISDSNRRHLPAVVLVVEDDSPVDRSRLVDLLERGRPAAVHVVWVSRTVARLPAACAAYVDTGNGGGAEDAAVGYVEEGRIVTPVALEALDRRQVDELARALAPLIDAGARLDDAADLPANASLLGLLGTELASSADAILDRWRINDSLPGSPSGGGRRKPHTLRAIVGATAEGGFPLDLREHGPHALVGGTTGSGKSEFLQSWVSSMAAEHSPFRVNFLFVDYKGGAAFGDCVRLPHCVGLVTDLSTRLVQRALTSLNAELRYREHALNAKKAKDLLELERRGDPDAPPALVIVVDEFAALVKEVPEFVEGVVNIAQRGRSLGLHLILATQRPAGVIKDNLRANTNLRIALRMADEEDSQDVVGTKIAASFDSSLPGRAVAKTGPGRLVNFQAGYLGGWTTGEPPPPRIEIEELAMGSGRQWEGADDESSVPVQLGPSDLQRMVSVISIANEDSGLPSPRRPWLDELAPIYELARAPVSRDDQELVFGIVDEPELQTQSTIAFWPDRDGHMAIFGTGGSGKTTLLRTLAVVAGLSVRGGACHVYGVDFGARGLQMLEAFDHVGAVINGDDDERIERLFRRLRFEIDERAARYAGVAAGDIADYRRITGQLDEPRILLLLDGFGPFRQAYEGTDRQAAYDLFLGLAAEGRQVGIHVVVTADRVAAVPAALSSAVQRQVFMRMAPEADGSVSTADIFTIESPPGRAMVGGKEVQVPVLGGTTDVTVQSETIRALAEEIRLVTPHSPAAPVVRLPEYVALSSMPGSLEGRPVFGVADRTLQPFSFVPEGVFLVVGPPSSGRTTTMVTVVRSLLRWRETNMVYFGQGRSSLVDACHWAEQGVGHEASAMLASQLEQTLAEADAVLPGVIVIEDIPNFLNGAAEYPLLGLVKRARDLGVLIVCDGETSAMGSGWDLLQAVRSARHGIALQPDQIDGETIFRTAFPRTRPAQFPPGRGIYVRAGALLKVQVAMADVDTT